VVAEVTLHLAADGGDGVGEQVLALLRLEAAHGLDQALESRLLEVVHRHAPAAVARGDGLGDADVGHHDLVEEPATLGRVRGGVRAA